MQEPIMKLDRIPFAARLALAGGLFAAGAAAHAASGYTITQSQEALVAPGMSAAQVRRALGHPARDIHYRNEPGPTFTYRVAGIQDTLFDVDFGADGKVASASERVDETGGHGELGGDR
jgi:hypothetical protein